MSVVNPRVDAIEVTNSFRKGAHLAVEFDISIQRGRIVFLESGHLVGMTIGDCFANIERRYFAGGNGLLFQDPGIQSCATEPETKVGAIQLDGERREVDGLEVQSERCGWAEVYDD